MNDFYINIDRECGIVTSAHDYPFFSAYTGIANFEGEFKNGVQLLRGDINDGGWALSYYLSVDNKQNRFLDNIRKDEIIIKIDGQVSSVVELRQQSFYVGCDNKREYCLRRPLKDLLEKAVKKSGSNNTVEDIINIFNLKRYNNKYNHGIETLQSRAALGFAMSKKVFCFPWLNNEYLMPRLYYILNTIYTLAKYDKIVIIPTNIPEAFTGLYNKIYDIRKDFNYNLKDEIIDFLNNNRKHM